MMLLNSVSLYFFTNWIFIIINVSLFGGLFRYTSLLSIVYFSEMYGNRASALYGMSLTGFLVGSFLSNNLCTYMVNPENLPMTTSYANGFEEHYFDYSISKNLVGFLNLMGLIEFLVCLFVSLFITDPEKYQSNFGKVFSYFKGNNSQELNDSLNSFKNTLDETFSEAWKQKKDDSLNQSISYSMHSDILSTHSLISQISGGSNKEKLLSVDVEKEVELQLEAEYKKELGSLTFWILFFASIIRNAQPSYFVENYKIQAYVVIDNDSLLTKIFSLSALTGVVGTLIASPIWTRFGLKKTYKLALIINIVCDILLVTVAPHSSFVFGFIILLARLYLSFDIQVNNLTMFCVYKPQIALRLSKIYDINFFLSIVVGVLMNFWLVTGTDYSLVYIVFAIFEVIALLLVILFIKQDTPQEEEENKDS